MIDIDGSKWDGLLDALAARVAAKLNNRPEQVNLRPRLLSVGQAAVYLGRTKEAVQHMIASGRVPTVRTDRRVFLDVRDLDRWIDDCKQAVV